MGISEHKHQPTSPAESGEISEVEVIARRIYESLNIALSKIPLDPANPFEVREFPNYLASRAASYESVGDIAKALSLYEQLLEFYETGPLLIDRDVQSFDTLKAQAAIKGVVRMGGNPSGALKRLGKICHRTVSPDALSQASAVVWKSNFSSGGNSKITNQEVCDLLLALPENPTLAQLEKIKTLSTEDEKRIAELNKKYEGHLQNARALYVAPSETAKAQFTDADHLEFENLREKASAQAMLRSFGSTMLKLAGEGIRNYSQVAILAHKMGMVEESEQFLKQAKVVAQMGQMDIKLVIKGSLELPAIESYSRDSAMEIAGVLKATDNFQEGIEFIFKYAEINRDTLYYLGETLPQLLKIKPKDPEVLGLVQNFLDCHKNLPMISNKISLLDYDPYVVEPKAKIALLLKQQFGFKGIA